MVWRLRCWSLSASVVLGGWLQWSWRFEGEATKFAMERKGKKGILEILEVH